MWPRPQPCTGNPQPAGHPEWSWQSCPHWNLQPLPGRTLSVFAEAVDFMMVYGSFQLNPWGLGRVSQRARECIISMAQFRRDHQDPASTINKDCLMKLSVHPPHSSGFHRRLYRQGCSRRTKLCARSKHPLTDRGGMTSDGPSTLRTALVQSLTHF